MSDNQKDLLFEVIKAQNQLCYFLMGLAASAIAFIIHQTRNLSPDDVVWQVWVALACWALSFGSGIIAARSRITASILNLHFLAAHKSVPPPFRSEAPFEAGLGEIKDNIDRSNGRQSFAMLIQQLAILAGATSYVWGHYEMMAMGRS